ncbi:MBL fold metallo-hydrolase [Phaeobacter sp. C3_T13_0]|uniref:MBL fold metallo-hydrolase n=1 Tax=Phaeobacter cretensis TaxID=3342641 RepID=UPI0039BD597D
MQAPDDFNPPAGVAEEIETGLRRLLAPNPSPMTYRGTNTYLLGTTDIAVIDPGPASNTHLHAILKALKPGQHISHILVSHSHLDHSPLARPLANATGAKISAFGAPSAGRSTVMTQLAEAGLAGGGEGIDTDFIPDINLRDGETLTGADWQLEVIHTPGHLGNHIAFAWNDACFTADHVMGWASSLVSPPDGDLTDFMASCRRLAEREWRIFYPGHGAPVDDPSARLNWLISHRQAREAAIMDELSDGPATVTELAARIYTETPPALLPAAERNVFAHLVDLAGKSRVRPDGPLSFGAIFERLP